MRQEVRITIAVDKKTGALRVVDRELKNTKRAAQRTGDAVARFTKRLRDIATATIGIYAVKKAFEATAMVGIRFASSMEDAKIGIASLISANAKVPAGMNKFQISMQAAKSVIEDLKVANTQTAATLPQLITGFQAAAAPALKAGLSLKQTVEYTKLMTIAAKAMLVPMNQLPQELKSVVSGTIDMNSVVAKNLGITNEQIKLHKKQGDLYQFLTGKLKAFNAAGVASSGSFSTILSNISDHWQNLMGAVIKNSGAFQGIKKALSFVDKELKKIKNDKEVMRALGEAGKLTMSILAKGAAMLIKSFGGILMTISTVKAGYNELWESIKIVYNKLIIKALEYKIVALKAINFFGSTSTAIKKVKQEIAGLTRANMEHKKSIFKIDEENRKFVAGIDKLSEHVTKMADSFSKNYKNKITKTVKSSTKKIKQDWHALLHFQSAKTKKTAKDIAKEAIKREKLEDEILRKIKRNAYEEYIYKLNKLNDWRKKKKEQIKKLIKGEADKKRAFEELDRAYHSQKIKLSQEFTKKQEEEAKKQKDAFLKANEKTVEGLKLGFNQVVESWRGNTVNMLNLGKDLATSLEQNLSNSFYNSFTGKISSISDFFGTAFDGIKRTFFKAVADMAAKELILGFKNVWSGNPNEGQGFVEKFLGIDIPFLKFAKGTIWGSGNYGVIPGNASYSGDDYRNDRIPALIAPGEAVLPRSAVEANRSLVESLIIGSRVGHFANGVINNPYVQKEQFRAEDGVYGLKHGGIIGTITKAVKGIWHGVKSIAKGAWNIIKKIGKGLWGAVKGVLTPLLKNPALGWLGQIAVGIIDPALIPTMLTADLTSTGLSLAMGDNLKDALKGAGLSGLISGGATAVSSLIKTGAMPVAEQGFWEAIKTYPKELWNGIETKWDSIKEGLVKLGDGKGLEGINAKNFPSIKEGFIKVGDYAKTLGEKALDTLTNYLKDPSKIFQYILDHLSNVITHIATTITGTLSNPFMASLATKGLIDKEKPLGIAGQIKQFGDGGLVHKRMIAEVAERGEPELITPLSRVGDLFDSKTIVKKLEQIENVLNLLGRKSAKVERVLSRFEGTKGLMVEVVSG